MIVDLSSLPPIRRQAEFERLLKYPTVSIWIYEPKGK